MSEGDLSAWRPVAAEPRSAVHAFRAWLVGSFLMSAAALSACDDGESMDPVNGIPPAGSTGSVDSGVVVGPGAVTGGPGPGAGTMGGGLTNPPGSVGTPGSVGGDAGTPGGIANPGTPGGMAMLDAGGIALADGGATTESGVASGGEGGIVGPRMDLGMGDGKDVITIGDSYMLLLTTGIQVSLEKISGRDYRNYAVPGTKILDTALLVLPPIPSQYDDAKREDPDIKTIVMTGGGNDVLGTSCSGTQCNEIVDRVSARLMQMQAAWAADGVEDVIIVSYGYPADQSKHASLDYSRSLLPTSCKQDQKPRCHFIDPVKELEGKISSDGIHPTDEGYDILGKMVWDLMQARGIRR